MEEIEVSILGTVYRNDDNGYSVVSCRLGRNEITVTGPLPELAPGEQARMSGQWTEHPRYGKQFHASVCQPIQPTSLLGIERFLGSGLIYGVGMATAKRIVHHFGEDTLNVLTTNPERLQEVPGLGKKRWRQIAASFQEHLSERESMVFLQSHGIPTNLAIKISKLYGDRAPEMIRSNPYRLCTDLQGVGFQTADRIATTLGVSLESEERVQAAIQYLLQEAAAAMGHVFLPREELIDRAASMLRVDPSLVTRQIDALALQRVIVMHTVEQQDRVYLRVFENAEREVAQRLLELLHAIPKSSEDHSRQIDSFQQRNNIRFSAMQREAIASALDSGVLVITGGPGTGKTTIIRCMIELLSEEGSVLLCAPTGRAAKRMTEATGAESKTIHRLLEYAGEDGAFARNSENPLEADCIIVDEMSMVDLMLMRSLLRAVEPGCRLILVGDADQLPSVGAGNVLGDILDSGVIPAVRLTDIFRQSETSRIVLNAHRIDRGEMPVLNEKGTDFFFVREEHPDRAASVVVELLTSRLPRYLHYDDVAKLRNIQVLAPSRKGETGVIALNHMLQTALNPEQRGKPALQVGESLFRLGDKVMQTHNDYGIEWRKRTRYGWEDGAGVFNGDVGFVTEVDPEERTLTVLFDEEKEVVYGSQQLENLELAYCLSVHKSQGSEFPCVVMPVWGGPPMLLTRNLFYTALTRARRMVVLVGREQTIRQMVENDHILHRWTALAERLRSTAEMVTAQ